MDPEPHGEFVRLYHAEPALVELIDHWLDQIEANPADATVRRRLIRPGSLWAITIADPAGEQDYLILWELDDETPVIRYLGPDVLQVRRNH